MLEQAVKKHPTIEAFSADQGYRKTAKKYVETMLKKLWKYQLQSLIAGPSLPNAGWSNGLSAGSTVIAVSQRTMKSLLLQPKTSLT